MIYTPGVRKWGLGCLGLAALAGLTLGADRTEVPDDLRDALTGRPPHLAPRPPVAPPALEPAPQLERLAPKVTTRSSLPLSREALLIARWHDAVLGLIEARGGFEALPPGTGTMLRLRLSVVSSWYWRDASGELFAKPHPFDRPRELRSWIEPVQEWLRETEASKGIDATERLYAALSS